MAQACRRTVPSVAAQEIVGDSRQRSRLEAKTDSAHRLRARERTRAPVSPRGVVAVVEGVAVAVVVLASKTQAQIPVPPHERVRVALRILGPTGCCREDRSMYELSTEHCFDSAHFLTDYHGACENLHGHRWRVTAYVASDELATSGTERGMVMDFARFKRIVREECDALDHSFLVEEGSLRPETIAALEGEGFVLTLLPFRTTAENLARYLAERLIARGLPIRRVDCDETPNNRASYVPPSCAFE